VARDAAAKRRGVNGAPALVQRLGYESSTGTGWATANSSRSSSSSGSDADSGSNSNSSEDDEHEAESSIEHGVFGDPDLSFPPHLPSMKRQLGGKAAAGGGVPAGHRSPAAKGAAAAAAAAPSPAKPRKVSSVCIVCCMSTADRGGCIMHTLAAMTAPLAWLLHILVVTVLQFDWDICSTSTVLHHLVYVSAVSCQNTLVCVLLRLCRAVLLLLVHQAG
jgi:hypothetical protein